MTVRELIEKLENYGDHVPVQLVYVDNNTERYFDEFFVEDENLTEVRVNLVVENFNA